MSSPLPFLAKKHILTLDRSIGGGGYGQNLAMVANSGDIQNQSKDKALAQAISDMWYESEAALFEKLYGQAKPDDGNFEGWGHFTQVLWDGSTSVGCAVQYCPPGSMVPNMGALYTVCNYAPAGMFPPSAI